MKAYLEYQDKKSHKFWQIEQKGKINSVSYGKVGSDGRETSKFQHKHRLVLMLLLVSLLNSKCLLRLLDYAFYRNAIKNI